MTGMAQTNDPGDVRDPSASRAPGGSGHSRVPAASGPQCPIRLLAVRDTPLSVDEVFAAIGDDGAGGSTFFVGTVRDHDGRQDAAVTSLAYTAHPAAEAELRRVAEKVAADFPVRALAAVHRVGELRVGDIAVVVAVSCAHRDEAFAACRRLIDDLKSQVPIWKHQTFADGAEEWVGV
ncbi:molybdenum cofactor biosynthesis protein MoaE [Actinacidiphila sp. ITFR-21]|uniref:molybdenum cofactor biosynthesis protein MoaE n=1 Tax=Actinacidiphila sp. ITFR-21 TaxID=3075199 RepID=UPI002889BEAF|nr:molybdenum cofactor biosynthesis protein MoaE [Streptomyces sp. ITFR-21]WNI17901.1 molybdenum cofactor biosynthesis protein MoaE [Streptomyces sp. ITFR-21]